MTDITLVNAQGLPPPAGHYSHAACLGELVFVSGLLPVTPSGQLLAGEPFERQAKQVLENLRTVLESCGASTDSLAQVRVYLSDIENWPEFNRIYADWIGPHRPARCVVPVQVLHYAAGLEIEAVAGRSD
jgi:reactive intermediate/imine deaminase